MGLPTDAAWTINTDQIRPATVPGPKKDGLKSTTALRPAGLTNTAADIGTQWYDATLLKPIWWNGTVWKDGATATV